MYLSRLAPLKPGAMRPVPGRMLVMFTPSQQPVQAHPDHSRRARIPQHEFIHRLFCEFLRNAQFSAARP